MTKITQIELIATTYAWYENEVRDLESKRTGDADKDALIDRMQEPLKAKCETLELMYEIETGESMFAD